MKGSTDYSLPDALILKAHLHDHNKIVKQNFVSTLSHDNDALKGLINLNSSKERSIKRMPRDQIEQYVQNFCSPGSLTIDTSLKMGRPDKRRAFIEEKKISK